MDFSFDSVDQFVRKVQDAKELKRQAVKDGLDPLLSDPSTFSISPKIGKMVDGEVAKYGDEALKQLCIVILGKWIDFHEGFLKEHIANEDVPASLLTMRDLNTLTVAVRLLEEVGSFGGDEDYCKAVYKEINQAVLEKLEEIGRDPEDVFNGNDYESLNDLL